MHDGPREGGHVGFVGDHQHGDAAVLIEVGQQFHDFHRSFRIEIAGRFVGQQHVRAGDDGAGDGDALLLAARQFGGGMIPPLFEAHLVERGHAEIIARLLVLAAIDERQFDIFERGGPREKVEALEHEAKIAAAQQGALIAVKRFHMMALEQEGPRRRHVEAAEDVHRCRFAGAGWSHHRDEIALLDVEVDAFQGLKGGRAFAIDFGDPAQGDDRSDRHAPYVPLGRPVPRVSVGATGAVSGALSPELPSVPTLAGLPSAAGLRWRSGAFASPEVGR